MKEKIDMLDFIQIKNFCFVKQLREWKKWATNWKKIFEKHISNEGLVSRIYKELLALNDV